MDKKSRAFNFFKNFQRVISVKNKFKIILAIGLIFISFTSNAIATGIAVSPSKIEIDDVLKGTEHERVLTIFNTDIIDDTFSLSVTGNISDWIILYEIDDRINPINNISIPAKSEAHILINLSIPDNTYAKEGYTSKIYVQSIPPELKGGQSAVLIKMPVDIIVNVSGKQILSGIIKSISTTDTEVNIPLQIRVEFLNTGNVIAKPIVNVDIVKDETEVDSLTYSEKEIPPKRKEIIPVEWNTSEMKSGDYKAKVSVILGEEVLETKELPFILYPVGTLTRNGELTSITCEDEPAVGTVMKIFADFVNTGKIDTETKFIGEVYKDEKLVDTIESNDRLVSVGGVETLTSYLTIDSPGSYTIKGHVEYEGRTTNTEKYTFDVSKGDSTPGFGIISVITAFLIFALIYRKKSDD